MLYIGPDVSYVTPIETKLMIVSSEVGEVEISCSPPSIIPSSVSFVTPGKTSISVTFPTIGTYIITASRGLEIDSCTVSVGADMCLLTGYITDIAGNPLRNTEVYIEPLRNDKGVALTTIIVYTDTSGYFAVPLYKGLDIIIRVHDTPYRKVVTVPDAQTADIKDL